MDYKITMKESNSHLFPSRRLEKNLIIQNLVTIGLMIVIIVGDTLIIGKLINEC